MSKSKSARSKPKRNPIRSAQQAEQERMALQSYWSDESQLTQRLLIYIARLLEKLVERRARPRKRSAYQSHVSRVVKAGGTMAEAAKLWREKQK